MNSWKSIDSSNSSLYVWESPSTGVYKARIAQIVSASYDSDNFGIALQNALNDASKTVNGSYTVTRATSNTSSGMGVGSAAFRYYTVSLTGGGYFSLPDSAHLRTDAFYKQWLAAGGPAYDFDQLRSSNDMVEFPGYPDFSSNWTSGYVDLRAKHSLCLHSTSIGNLSSMGPRGIRTAIAVIPVTQPYGGMTNWSGSGNVHDFIEPATRSLKRISFEVQSFRGEIVKFNGGHWAAVFVIGTRP